MNHPKACLVVVASLLLGLGCGDVDEESRRDQVHLVSFVADYPDVYGDILVEIEGTSVSFPVGPDESPCVEVKAPEGTSYRASSSRGFSWSGTVGGRSRSCSTIALGAGDVVEVLHAIIAPNPWEVPAAIKVDGEPAGTLMKSWHPNPFDDLETIDCLSIRAYFLDAHREGKAIVIPLAEGQTVEILKGDRSRQVISWDGATCAQAS